MRGERRLSVRTPNRVLRRTVLACVLVIASARPSGATTLVFMDSDPWDFVGQGIRWSFTEPDAVFTTYRLSNAVRVDVQPPAALGGSWTFQFGPPAGWTLAPGVYENATSSPLPTANPTIAIYGDYRACNVASGRFQVLDVGWQFDGGLARLAVDFEYHCENQPFALHGSVRFRSELASDPVDADGDGIPNAIDDCPEAADSSQTDRDADGIGDACDPYPDQADNVAQCIEDTASLLALTRDDDGDGEANPTDRCPTTPTGAAVDQAGCSLDEFCGAVTVRDAASAARCERSDWRGDEPHMRRRDRDCRVERGDGGARCVANEASMAAAR